MNVFLFTTLGGLGLLLMSQGEAGASTGAGAGKAPGTPKPPPKGNGGSKAPTPSQNPAPAASGSSGSVPAGVQEGPYYEDRPAPMGTPPAGVPAGVYWDESSEGWPSADDVGDVSEILRPVPGEPEAPPVIVLPKVPTIEGPPLSQVELAATELQASIDTAVISDAIGWGLLPAELVPLAKEVQADSPKSPAALVKLVQTMPPGLFDLLRGKGNARQVTLLDQIRSAKP